MNKILELREKRNKIWNTAKEFLDQKRGADGFVPAEAAAEYDKMEADMVALGKEIERLERQAAYDLEMSKPTSAPILGAPNKSTEDKTGRASAEYRKAFWNAMRTRGNEGLDMSVKNALQIGTDSEGGYLVPDEFERTLVEALDEENVFRRLANVITTSSGDRKIPVVASKGTASWIDEEGTIPDSDEAFGQVSIGAYKLGTLIKVRQQASRTPSLNIANNAPLFTPVEDFSSAGIIFFAHILRISTPHCPFDSEGSFSFPRNGGMSWNQLQPKQLSVERYIALQLSVPRPPLRR